MTTQQVQILRQIGSAIVETVREAGAFGAPGGILYTALMKYGCTLNQFTQIMAGLCQAGLLEKRGDCYHIPTPAYSAAQFELTNNGAPVWEAEASDLGLKPGQFPECFTMTGVNQSGTFRKTAVMKNNNGVRAVEYTIPGTLVQAVIFND